MILNWFHKGKENSIHIYVTFSLVIYGNLDGVYVSKGMTCIFVHKDVLFASHTIACSISPGHIYLLSIHYIHLSFHIPNLIFSTHSHSFPHHPHPLVHFFMTFMCFLVENERKNIFFIILASLCSLLLVYINISYVYVWLRARTNPTQTSCYEGVFLFLITAIVCTLYTISTFTFFSFSSLALNRHFSLTLRSEFFFEKCTKKISKYTCKEKKKNDEKHAILSFAKEHTYFTRHIRPSRIGRSKEVWQLLWGGRSLKCWLSAFRFSFKYIGLFFLKMSLFSHLKVIKLSFTFTNFRNFSLHGMSPS